MMESEIINKDFFKEEEICGHYVTALTKKLWAVQLGCLEELKRICHKHSITYYACGGTLLGAVRHKGYIPWDDDLDVMMFEKDYIRFCEVAPKELSHPYFFQNYKTNEGASAGMSRIRNSETTGCTQYEIGMASGGYNCGVFIDIFPLFGVEENRVRLFFQKCEMFIWWLALAGYEHCKKLRLTGLKLKSLVDPSIYWWTLLSLFLNHEKVSAKYLKACGRAKQYSKVGLLSFDGFNKKLIWDREWFGERITMPFEYTQLECPRDYDPILRTQYGDYMKFVKGGAIHTMAVVDPDTPYTIKIREKLDIES